MFGGKKKYHLKMYYVQNEVVWSAVYTVCNVICVGLVPQLSLILSVLEVCVVWSAACEHL